MLITRETKLAIVKKHLEDGVTLKELSEEYGIHSSNIKFYVALYRNYHHELALCCAVTSVIMLSAAGTRSRYNSYSLQEEHI